MKIGVIKIQRNYKKDRIASSIWCYPSLFSQSYFKLFKFQRQGTGLPSNPATDISTLNNTSIFREGALPHILDGDVKVKLDIITGLPKKENVSGYHSNTITGIPTIDSSTIIVDPVTGVYKAKVINPISGTVKGGNQGYSTFFPDNWTAQQKVDAMNEAYNNRKPVANTRNTYEGITKEGIIMEMYIDENTKQVISSFPKF